MRELGARIYTGHMFKVILRCTIAQGMAWVRVGAEGDWMVLHVGFSEVGC